MRRYQGLCTDLLAFTLQPRKTSARRLSDKGIVSNWVLYLQMTSVGSQCMSGRENKGNKKRMGRIPLKEKYICRMPKSSELMPHLRKKFQIIMLMHKNIYMRKINVGNKTLSF